MTPDPRSTVEKLLGHLRAGTVAEESAAVAALLADDVTYQFGVGTPTASGPDAVVAELSRQTGHYTDLAIEVSGWVVTDPAVVVERVDTFTLKHNGAVVTNPILAIFELDADARITGWREYWDTAVMAKAVPAG